MKTFQEMGLPCNLCGILKNMQFIEPTPIQAKAIPLALNGKDIMGAAHTGTGKTAAFGVPLIARLLSNSNSVGLVMTPTRELATQVITQLKNMLGQNTKLKSTLLIGGDPIDKQLKQLKQKPRLIVGTPGRINDHLKRKTLNLSNTDFLVLDETDRMLDMGFTIQVENIIKHTAAKRQTLLFSATLPKNIMHISKKYLNNPISVIINETSETVKNIIQDVVYTNKEDKYTNLLSELDQRTGSILIFIKSKFGTEKMATKLLKDGYSTKAIHGDLRQNKREKVLTAFRKRKYRILVATDIAARGLDIPHIEHVINYDLPQCPEDYIHRIGRTARAGAKGSALNIITPADRKKWKAINLLLHPNKKSLSKKAFKISKNRQLKNSLKLKTLSKKKKMCIIRPE